MSPREYHLRPRREMRDFVPAGARSVLDVGCGAGAFGAGLKQARPGLEVWGVEADAEAAAHAADLLDRVVAGTAPAVLDELGGRRFDCVVLNDVVEHVAWPQELLRALHAHLLPGGRLVASIPNIRHHTVLVDLAWRGRWEYADEGLLDRTHLRFYTRASMVALLRRCGYRVIRVAGINRSGALGFRLFDLLTFRRFRDLGYLQFACVAEPEEVGAP